jgi:chloramphenicol 3-O-phosphotransferase
MAEEKRMSIDVNAEVARYFDDSSRSKGQQPRIVVIMGGVSAGKTTMRKDRFSTGHVLVDAVPIFLSLCRGGVYPFPGPFEKAVEIIGYLVAVQAIQEKRHIVTEIVGAEAEPTQELLKAMQSAGYHVELVLVTCEMEECLRRNANRGPDEISCYYAEPLQRSWLIKAAGAGSQD